MARHSFRPNFDSQMYSGYYLRNVPNIGLSPWHISVGFLGRLKSIPQIFYSIPEVDLIQIGIWFPGAQFGYKLIIFQGTIMHVS